MRKTSKTPPTNLDYVQVIENKDVLVRRASKSDISAIEALENQIFTGSDELFSRARFRYLLSSQNAAVLVCFHGSEPIGYGIALISRLRNKKLKGRIYSIGIVSKWRKRGIGEEFLHELEKWLVAAGVAFITLETRADSLGVKGFFTKLGYRVVKVLPDYYPQSDGFRMVKRVEEPAQR